HPDAFGGVVDGHGLGEADDPRLGGAVGRVVLHAVLARTRRHVDNGATALGLHQRKRVVTHEERGREVEVDDGVPVVLCDLGDVLPGTATTHHVGEHVDPTELLLGQVD